MRSVCAWPFPAASAACTLDLKVCVYFFRRRPRGLTKSKRQSAHGKRRRGRLFADVIKEASADLMPQYHHKRKGEGIACCKRTPSRLATCMCTLQLVRQSPPQLTTPGAASQFTLPLLVKTIPSRRASLMGKARRLALRMEGPRELTTSHRKTQSVHEDNVCGRHAA